MTEILTPFYVFQVTILVLEDLPGCSLSTLAQCTRLQSLTMRRCGLKVLEGISRLADLCYVDVPVSARVGHLELSKQRSQFDFFFFFATGKPDLENGL